MIEFNRNEWDECTSIKSAGSLKEKSGVLVIKQSQSTLFRLSRKRVQIEAFFFVFTKDFMFDVMSDWRILDISYSIQSGPSIRCKALSVSFVMYAVTIL